MIRSSFCPNYSFMPCPIHEELEGPAPNSVSLNANWFGNRIFADIIKMRSLGGLWFTMTDVFIRTGKETQRYKGRQDDIKTHRENVMCRQEWDWQLKRHGRILLSLKGIMALLAPCFQTLSKTLTSVSQTWAGSHSLSFCLWWMTNANNNAWLPWHKEERCCTGLTWVHTPWHVPSFNLLGYES
jgi:hypothetical protein